MEYKLTADCESDIELVASYGTRDAGSDYSDSSGNLTASSGNCTELAAQTHELEKIHKEVITELQ